MNNWLGKSVTKQNSAKTISLHLAWLLAMKLKTINVGEDVQKLKYFELLGE